MTPVWNCEKAARVELQNKTSTCQTHAVYPDTELRRAALECRSYPARTYRQPNALSGELGYRSMKPTNRADLEELFHTGSSTGP